MNSSPFIGCVIITFANFPLVIEPSSWLTSIAYAVFNVVALNASSGVILYLIHAADMINCILPDGDVPGLKSDAIATGSPALIISRTGDNGRFKKKAHPGNTVGIVSEPLSASISPKT